MTCNDIKILLPELLREPGKHPEAEAHLQQCPDCRKELELLRALRNDLSFAFPDVPLTETLPQRIRLMRRIHREAAARHLIYAVPLAAVLVLSLILAPFIGSRETPPDYYTHYETETLEVLSALDLSAGMQISDEEIALYLIENGEISSLQEITF